MKPHAGNQVGRLWVSLGLLSDVFFVVDEIITENIKNPLIYDLLVIKSIARHGNLCLNSFDFYIYFLLNVSRRDDISN